VRYELHGLTAAEIGQEFDFDRMLNHGYLPSIYLSNRPQRLLNSTLRLPERRSRRGRIGSKPSRVLGFSRGVAVGYQAGELFHHRQGLRCFQRDDPRLFPDSRRYTVGTLAAGIRQCPKRRVIAAPKFFFADVGVVNHLAKRGELRPGSELYGKALENWVFHELTAHNAYTKSFATLSDWRLASGIEVDFIVNDMQAAIEAKAAAKITADHLKGLRALAEDHPRIKRRVIVCLEPRRRRTEDGILVVPALQLGQLLKSGELF
jgi:hypothetical protein